MRPGREPDRREQQRDAAEEREEDRSKAWRCDRARAVGLERAYFRNGQRGIHSANLLPHAFRNGCRWTVRADEQGHPVQGQLRIRHIHGRHWCSVELHVTNVANDSDDSTGAAANAAPIHAPAHRIAALPQPCRKALRDDRHACRAVAIAARERAPAEQRYPQRGNEARRHASPTRLKPLAGASAARSSGVTSFAKPH
jgi:hypothetical protein